jgi:hypothetical protein
LDLIVAEEGRMGELLNRELQRKILTGAAAEYPGQLILDGWSDEDQNSIVVNTVYLYEHGLLTVDWQGQIPFGVPRYLRITAKGLDFLADDGGLSAILGVVTVKFHDDTIKALLLDRVKTSDAPLNVRRKLADQINSLPADALHEISISAVKSGLERIPDVVGWIAKLLESGA